MAAAASDHDDVEQPARGRFPTLPRQTRSADYRNTFHGDRCENSLTCENTISHLPLLQAIEGKFILDVLSNYTEPSMNTAAGRPISETALPAGFDSPDYNVLLVAEKYQTCYGQPPPRAMYVDKALESIHAVQTLSRLNRVAPHKEASFVLDFVNNPEDIRAAFAPY